MFTKPVQTTELTERRIFTENVDFTEHVRPVKSWIMSVSTDVLLYVIRQLVLDSGTAACTLMCPRRLGSIVYSSHAQLQTLTRK